MGAAGSVPDACVDTEEAQAPDGLAVSRQAEEVLDTFVDARDDQHFSARSELALFGYADFQPGPSTALPHYSRERQPVPWGFG